MASPDQIEYDIAYLTGLELEIQDRIRYWRDNCDGRIPDHVAWEFKQRLHLLNRLLLDLQNQCQHSLNHIKTYDSESDWIEDWLIERAFSKLRGK